MSLPFKIDYRNYPEFMFGIIASYLPTKKGEDLRRIAGKVVFKHKDKYGNTYKNGALHSFDDLPSVSDGDEKKWYKDGKLHREGDLPAFIVSDDVDQQEWYYKNGKLHREGDKPAVIERTRFFINNDSPITYICKNKWYKNGMCHREGDLPASITEYHEIFYDDIKNPINSQPTIKYWYQNGKLHRDNDRPAVSDGEEEKWYQNGKLHRDNDRPAHVKGEEEKFYINGKRINFFCL